MRSVVLASFCLVGFGFFAASAPCKTVESQAAKGMPVKLMVLRDIGSAFSYPGETVPLVVTQDVQANGQVVITEGTMVFARISKSRREGALSATVLDRPARLSIRFERARDDEGREIALLTKPNKDGELHIAREMTRVKASPEEQKLFQLAWEDRKVRPVMEKVRGLFAREVGIVSEKEAQILMRQNLPIPFVQQALEAGAWGMVKSFLSDLRRGRPFEAFLGILPVTRPARIALRAIRDLGRLSGSLGNYIGGRFKGRNIYCPAGVEMTVYVGG